MSRNAYVVFSGFLLLATLSAAAGVSASTYSSSAVIQSVSAADRLVRWEVTYGWYSSGHLGLGWKQSGHWLPEPKGQTSMTRFIIDSEVWPVDQAAPNLVVGRKIQWFGKKDPALWAVIMTRDTEESARRAKLLSYDASTGRMKTQIYYGENRVEEGMPGWNPKEATRGDSGNPYQVIEHVWKDWDFDAKHARVLVDGRAAGGPEALATDDWIYVLQPRPQYITALSPKPDSYPFLDNPNHKRLGMHQYSFQGVIKSVDSSQRSFVVTVERNGRSRDVLVAKIHDNVILMDGHWEVEFDHAIRPGRPIMGWSYRARDYPCFPMITTDIPEVDGTLASVDGNRIKINVVEDGRQETVTVAVDSDARLQFDGLPADRAKVLRKGVHVRVYAKRPLTIAGYKEPQTSDLRHDVTVKTLYE